MRDTTREFLDTQFDLYVDGELAELERGEMEALLNRCDKSRAEVRRRQELKDELRQLGDEAHVCDDFRARLSSGLSRCELELDSNDSPASRWWGYGAAAAVVPLALGGAFLASNGSPDAPIPAGASVSESVPAEGRVMGAAEIRSPIVDESIRWHRRQMPVEVTGPDPGYVTSWFEDKVSFAMNVPVFEGNVNLLGGRLIQVQQSDSAFLVYETEGTKLSVLVFDGDLFDAGDESEDGVSTIYVDNSSGYNVALVEVRGVGYALTSVLEQDELVRLAESAF